MPHSNRYRLIRVLVAGFLVLILGGAILIHEYDNFHPVVAGEVYRSAQLSGSELEKYVRMYRLKSIINLIGRRQKEAWWRDEVAVSTRYGLTHYDFHISAGTPLTAEQYEQLLALLKTAPKPLLIHCHGGADRTGLASAMYLLHIRGVPFAEAKKELSVWRGHIPFLFNKTKAMDQTFEKFAMVQ